ncbi:MAG: FG-GAP repeat protein [Chloroflexi bacterium]|nr:FG-GAP repeat protein [Chloroflexota bacterium]
MKHVTLLTLFAITLLSSGVNLKPTTNNRTAAMTDETLQMAYSQITIAPWIQQAKLTASDGSADAVFGSELALSGDTALIGSPGDEDNGVASGSAYVFTRSGTLWNQQAKLLPANGFDYHVFGGAVALDGDTALIGAYGDFCTAGEWCGSAYVFTRSGSTWTQQARLTAPDADDWDYFGVAVAIDGDTALIGAFADECAVGDDCGSAYVFVHSGGLWSQQAKLAAPDLAAYDGFGGSVALDGDTALIGASDADCVVWANCGSVYVYIRSGTIWSQQAKLLPSNAVAQGRFGGSVSLDGDNALIGAEGDKSVYAFIRSGTLWTQQARLTTSDSPEFQGFGASVALAGDMALIGAYLDDDNGYQSGSAYVFTRSGTVWSQQDKLLPVDGASEDWFGGVVALDATTALVGVSRDECAAGDHCGSVYAFGIVLSDTIPLDASAACNGPDLEVNIAAGDGPFDILTSAGINSPIFGVGMGITTINGPEKWDNLTVRETTGLESTSLGQFKCRTDERPMPLMPAHQSHTTDPFPLFSWTEITDANNYRVFVFDEANPAIRMVDIRENSGGPASMTLTTPLPDGRFFWRVRGRQNRIWSMWSVRFTLFKDPGVPVSITGSTPVPTSNVAPPNDRSTPIPTVGPADGAIETPALPAPPNSR